jgi:hypothetical protein
MCLVGCLARFSRSSSRQSVVVCPTVRRTAPKSRPLPTARQLRGDVNQPLWALARSPGATRIADPIRKAALVQAYAGQAIVLMPSSEVVIRGRAQASLVWPMARLVVTASRSQVATAVASQVATAVASPLATAVASRVATAVGSANAGRREFHHDSTCLPRGSIHVKTGRHQRQTPSRAILYRRLAPISRACIRPSTDAVAEQSENLGKIWGNVGSILRSRWRDLNRPCLRVEWKTGGHFGGIFQTLAVPTGRLTPLL